jgi:hypothetical protein
MPTELVVVLCICFSSRVSCFPKVLRLVFVKLFWLMMCFVLEKVSSVDNF